MRRLGWIITVLMLALLCACAEQPEGPSMFEVDYEGKHYTVDLIEQTFAFDDVVCRFEINTDVIFRVIYPDGSFYWKGQDGNEETRGWSEDYSPNRYAPGETLWNVLGRQTGPTNARGRYMPAGILLIVVGAIYAFAPRTGWKVNRGGQSEDMQPPRITLTINRVAGGISIAAGLVCMFI